MERIPVWLERYEVPIALFGLASGVASYVLIDRQPRLAAGIAIATLAGWGLLLLEALVLSPLPDSPWSRAGTGVFQLTLQAIHQEALFFVATFAVLSTDWGSGQVAFTLVIVGLTAIASIDPIYHLTLARSRLGLLAFHAVIMFLCGFMALPIALQAPLDVALLSSLAFTALFTWPLLFRALEGARRLVVSTLVVATICGGLWSLRSLLPPMSTRMGEPAVSVRFDLDEREPVDPRARFAAEEVVAGGLFAYTPIQAPLGLSQGVIHDWSLDGEPVDRIPMEISGGRREGFRSWSHKRNFPAEPAGRWTVTVRTPLGIVLGSFDFEVAAPVRGLGAPEPFPADRDAPKTARSIEPEAQSIEPEPRSIEPEPQSIETEGP